jgi:hypothetical protein
MVNIKKNVLTQKQAEEENVGTYHHPTNKTWRSGACIIGEELRKGHYRRGYTTKSGKKVETTYVNTSCSKTSKEGRTIKEVKIKNNNEFRKKILTEKQALEKPIGTYYHPKETTWRSGACPNGEILKKGYKRKSYITKTGKVVPETYVNPICIKDKGKKGKKIVNTERNTEKNTKVNNTKMNNTKVNNKLIKKYTVEELINNIPVNITFSNTARSISSNNNKVNNAKVNNTKVNNTKVNNTKVNNKLIKKLNHNIEKYMVEELINNSPNNNTISNNIHHNKFLKKSIHNIEEPTIQELTNNMIINLMKKNRL